MRIFSNFNTKLREKVIDDKLESYNIEEVFTIYRSKYYLFFHVLSHLTGYLTILFLSIFIIAYLGSPLFVYIMFIGMWLLIVRFRVFYKFLKYFCDFTVVTPGGITTYKQKGILHSVLKEIPSRRIKAIEISRIDLLGNIFGYGYVDIIADMGEMNHLGGSDEAPWIMSLSYVDRPYVVKEKISKICFK